MKTAKVREVVLHGREELERRLCVRARRLLYEEVVGLDGNDAPTLVYRRYEGTALVRFSKWNAFNEVLLRGFDGFYEAGVFSTVTGVYKYMEFRSLCIEDMLWLDEILRGEEK